MANRSKPARLEGPFRKVGSGKILFKIPFPEFDLKFNIDNSRVTFLKKSSVVASSNINITGEKIPYTIGGNISISHGSVEDEFNGAPSPKSHIIKSTAEELKLVNSTSKGDVPDETDISKSAIIASANGG